MITREKKSHVVRLGWVNVSALPASDMILKNKTGQVLNLLESLTHLIVERKIIF